MEKFNLSDRFIQPTKTILMLAERTSNTEGGLPWEGSPAAEFGTRSVTRCGTLATQVPEEKEKESGGEGGIARGRGRPLVLRFAPDRRVRVVPNRSAIWSNPGGLTRAILALALRAHCVRPNSLRRICRPHTLHLLKIKRPLEGAPFYFQWRRGWDSNPRAGITRPSDFESAPL